jgi:chemotaxis regulatin CheY-phosphate phosphatase CheZ
VGLIDGLPERFKNQRTADAVMAPSSILLAGAGAAAGILAGFSVFGVVGLALALGIARVATLLPRGARSSRIDPMSIGDPWRHFVREALDAQRRYRKAVDSANEGPMRDRLVEIGERIDAGVDECWRIARRGDALENAIDNLDIDAARQELADATRDARADDGDTQKETVQALQAQVDSGDRLVKVAEEAQDKLRLLDARLDEAVARAIELAIKAEDVGELGGLGTDVDSLVSEMESLRVGLEEASGTAQAAGAGA